MFLVKSYFFNKSMKLMAAWPHGRKIRRCQVGAFSLFLSQYAHAHSSRKNYCAKKIKRERNEMERGIQFSKNNGGDNTGVGENDKGAKVPDTSAPRAVRPMGLLVLLLYECVHLVGNLAHALH